MARALGSALCWFQAPNGAVHDVAVAELLGHERTFELDYVPSRPAIWPDLEQALDTIPIDDPVFLLALHGIEGEDGTVQRLLEARKLPFTGSGSAASAAGFDKVKAKEIVSGKLRLAESRTARGRGDLRQHVDHPLTRHEKIVLKPVARVSKRRPLFRGPYRG